MKKHKSSIKSPKVFIPMTERQIEMYSKLDILLSYALWILDDSEFKQSRLYRGNYKHSCQSLVNMIELESIRSRSKDTNDEETNSMLDTLNLMSNLLDIPFKIDTISIDKANEFNDKFLALLDEYGLTPNTKLHS